VPWQRGFAQKLWAAGKAYVPHDEHRLPSRAGRSASVLNHPSTAGTAVRVAASLLASGGSASRLLTDALLPGI
jgi:hypothetical protein